MREDFPPGGIKWIAWLFLVRLPDDPGAISGFWHGGRALMPACRHPAPAQEAPPPRQLPLCRDSARESPVNRESSGVASLFLSLRQRWQIALPIGARLVVRQSR